VLAALIVGAALMTQVSTPFRLFGYLALAASIVISDRKQNRKAPASPSQSKLA